MCYYEIMNMEMRSRLIADRNSTYNAIRRVRIRKEREYIVDSTEALARTLEMGRTADLAVLLTYDVNNHWLEAEHRNGIPLLLAIRGLAVSTDLDRTVDPPVLHVTREDPVDSRQ